MSTPPLLTTLNELIQTSADARKAFADASQRASDPGLKLELRTRSQFCERSIHELRTLVGYLGGNAVDGGSVSGTACRGGVAVRAAAAGNDDLAVLEDVERSEDHAKAAYGKALNAELPLDVRSTVEQQYASVLRQHDLTRVLRDSCRRSPAITPRATVTLVASAIRVPATSRNNAERVTLRTSCSSSSLRCL